MRLTASVPRGSRGAGSDGGGRAAVVDWTLQPGPDSGAERLIVGHGAARVEAGVQPVSVLVAATALPAAAVLAAWGWGPLHLLVASLLAAGLVGGRSGSG